jgi:hypothetical protein
MLLVGTIDGGACPSAPGPHRVLRRVQEAATVGGAACIRERTGLPGVSRGWRALLAAARLGYVAQLMGNAHDERRAISSDALHFRVGEPCVAEVADRTQVPQAVGCARACRSAGAR